MKKRNNGGSWRRLAVIALRRLAVAAGIVALTATAAWGWKEARSRWDSGQLAGVRFHVVPHGDGGADQRLKWAVRDAVWPEVEQGLAAGDLARPQRLESLQRTAAAELARQGADRTVRVATEVTDGGRLTAIKIVLGDGRGANWFCVLAPPLCFADLEPVERVAPNPGEEPEQGGVRLAWKWLGRLFGGLSVPFEGVRDVDQDDVHSDLAHAAPGDGDVGLGGE